MNECHWKSILKSVTYVDIGNFWFAFVTTLNVLVAVVQSFPI